MLSPAQESLIRWLGRFPRDLAQAWDVPRDLSLPGLSEAMGVVRSALHAPLKQLSEMGLIESRLAHVVGGGARRRNVYHLTSKGWELFSGLPDEDNPAISAARRGKVSGNAPAYIPIIGRESDVEKIIKSVNDFGNSVILGLPGIGKTSLLRVVAEELIDSGKNIAWAKCTQFDDTSALLSGAFDGDVPPTSSEALVSWVRRKIGRGVLFVDELQEVHPRHISTVVSTLKNVLEDGINMVIGCRAPSPIETEQTFLVEELDDESARTLLGENIDLELASKIVGSLGGHPLALKLHNVETDIGKIGADISEYIEKTVIDSLPSECMPGLDELAAMPLPVGVDRLSNLDSVGVLDEHALLRWADEESSAVELQHLVRHVRREMWNEVKKREVHLLAAERWSEHPEPQARFVEFHHRLAADDKEVSKFITLHSEDLGNCDDGALAALLHDGIQKNPEEDALWYLATKTALDRGEGDVVEDLLERMPNVNSGEALALRSRYALQLGNQEEAKKLQEQAITSASVNEKVRIEISYLSRVLEDRLPSGQTSIATEEILARINSLKLGDLNPETRQNALVAIAIIKHNIALIGEDFSGAAKIRKQLESISQKSDPIIVEMEIKESVRIAKWGSADWIRESEAIRKLIKSSSPIRALSLRLFLVEKMVENEIEETRKLLEHIEEVSFNGPAARRLIAKVWYWKGVVEESNRMEFWREAIHRYRSAECAHAAQELTQKMHEMLR